MSSWDGRLLAYGRALADNRASIEISRRERRVRYKAAVAANVFRWRHGIGHNAAPLMDEQAIRQHVHSISSVVIERRLLALVAPVLLSAQALERSMHHVSIYASPGTGNSRERYAPKKPLGTVPHQIRIGGTR